MYYVYLLRSVGHPDQKYIGITEDIRKRHADHNSGFSKHTAKYMPWELVTYHAFQDKYRAYAFEKYLKTGSGKAFASKRFCSIMLKKFYLKTASGRAFAKKHF